MDTPTETDISITITDPTWADPTDERFIPPVVMNPFTGADYDTLLSMLDGWVVRVHLINDDGKYTRDQLIGTVRHDHFDDCIHIVNDDDNFILTIDGGRLAEVAIDLANVRWIQVL